MSRPTNRLGSDLFLALASLLIAFVIWTIAKRGDETVEIFSAPLRLTNVPPNVTARIEPETVKISLRVPNSLRGRVQSAMFWVEYDFDKGLPEPRTWCGIEDFKSSKKLRLDTAFVRILGKDEDDLRRKIQFSSIDDEGVVVKAKLVTRPAKLEFPTKGDLAPGYRLAEAIKPADPVTIYLTASPAVFKQITGSEDAPVRISTDEIDLSGQKASFSVTVALRLPSDVDLVYPDLRLVKAEVTIEEIVATVENVPIVVPEPPEDLLLEYSPHNVAVSVRGPEEILKRLKPSDFIVRPAREVLPAAGLEISVPLEAVFLPNTPKAITEAVGIRGVAPDTAALKFSPRNTAPERPSANPPRPFP